MTRVDFYILPDADEDRRQTYLCRLAEKAYRLGHRVWIHVPADDRAGALDDRLWTFSQGSFVPHERASDADPDCPVVLAEGLEPGSDCELLINEDAEVPSFFSRFPRVAEVVNQNGEIRRRGRERYTFYRDRGYELHHHEVS
ncbi:MAG: DNA polymerase III subunit chi [Halofilum sp. (in: g-proteobacteria)]|nr:DNA polymerase III subunit chi [Halofilum sp. (in: g-proteobacteria)]